MVSGFGERLTFLRASTRLGNSGRVGSKRPDSDLGLNFAYQGSNFYVVGDEGRVFDNSPLANASARVEIQVDINGKPLKASIKLSK